MCAGPVVWTTGHCCCGYSDLGNNIIQATLVSLYLSYCVAVQGSVVVFGSWAEWTDTDLTSQHYCKKTPMMFAFVLLILSWVRVVLKGPCYTIIFL